jgi:hypothetical protein
MYQVFGPQMPLAYRLDAISQGPKNSRFLGPNTLPLALVKDAACIKSITHGVEIIGAKIVILKSAEMLTN